MNKDGVRDPRITKGMARQCAARADLINRGARPRGWKVGLTTPSSQAVAGIDAALIGFLTDATELSDGGVVEIAEWRRPMVEAEIAIKVVADVPPEADTGSASAAIGALAAAIEVVDLTVSLDQVEELLAANIFHRRFLLGAEVEGRRGGDASGIEVSAWLDDELAATESDPCAVIGELAGVVQHVAAEAASAGLRLERGDWILAGSAIPLTPVSPGQRLRVEASGLGELSLGFA